MGLKIRALLIGEMNGINSGEISDGKIVVKIIALAQVGVR